MVQCPLLYLACLSVHKVDAPVFDSFLFVFGEGERSGFRVLYFILVLNSCKVSGEQKGTDCVPVYKCCLEWLRSPEDKAAEHYTSHYNFPTLCPFHGEAL